MSPSERKATISALLGEAVGQPGARDDAEVGAGAERHDVIDVETRASAGPSRRVNRAGSRPASRASRSAAAAVAGEQSGAVRNGPLSG